MSVEVWKTSKKSLPKSGDKIPLEKFHVSPMNVRYGQPFDPDKNEKDYLLLRNLRAGELEQPFKARPEPNPETGAKDEFGVYMGRRRYEAEKYRGQKFVTVGAEVLVKNASDYEARKASFVEGDDALRVDVDPISRAKHLQKMAAENTRGITGVAEDLGAAKGRISEYIRVLDLDPSMQKQVTEERLSHSKALQVARMELSSETQQDLAKTLEEDGLERFEKELERYQKKEKRRGAPPDKYDVVRLTYDKYFDEDMKDIGKLDKFAEEKNFKGLDARSRAAKTLLHEKLEEIA